MTLVSDDGSFDIVPVAVSTYAHHPPVPADEEAHRIAEVLTADLDAAIVRPAADERT